MKTDSVRKYVAIVLYLTHLNRYKCASLACAAWLTDTKYPPEAPKPTLINYKRSYFMIELFDYSIFHSLIVVNDMN